MKTLIREELSQFLSLILRHKPATIQLDLDAYGYANIDEIIQNGKNSGLIITEKEIRNVVLYSDKNRFKITGNRIKAIQGHSFEITIEEQNQKPPEFLYHGTKSRLKEIISQQGLLGIKRNSVHLYEDYYAAFMNRTKPLVFEINAREMYKDGYEFYLFDKDVWQTKTVPARYLTIKTLNEIDRLKKITVTKTSWFTKITTASIALEPGFNAHTPITVKNCYLCGSGNASYNFDDGKLRCSELTYERPAKHHLLIGKAISFEQIQNGKEIICRSVYEIEIREDAELYIREDPAYQGIGIRFHCPHCNELEMVSNIHKTGEEINCSHCNTPLLKIDKPTEITKVQSIQ